MKLLIIILGVQGWQVFGEVCSTASGAVAKTCDYGCCSDDCCSDPFWSWYIIIGIAVGSIGVIVLVVAIIFMLCCYNMKQKTRSTQIRQSNFMRSSRVEPDNSLYSEGMYTVPSHRYSGPPPSYSEAQLPGGVPKPNPIIRIPRISRSRNIQGNVE